MSDTLLALLNLKQLKSQVCPSMVL